MAISNYTELKSSIASYLARSDLTNVIPDFIGLAEAKLKRRFRDVTTLSDGNTSNWLLTNHPDVYLYGALLEAQPYLMDDARIATWAQIFERVVAEVRLPNVNANLANYAGLQLAISDWLARPDLDAVIPEFIQLTEAKLKRKFRDVTSLSGSNTTNWLLTAHPDVYLYGALVESQPYLMNDVRIPVWTQIFEKAVIEVRRPNTSANFTNYSGLQLAISDWLNRPDLDNAIPNFIELVEAKLQRRFRSVTALTTQNTSNWLLDAHPDAYLYGALVEAQPYLMDDARVPVWITAFEKTLLEIRRPDTSANLNDYSGLQLAVSDWLARPDLDAVIPEFIQLAEAKLKRRFRDVTTLTSQNTTNWLITAHPDAYLYGALVEAQPYLKDDVRVQLWVAAFEKVVGEIRRPDTNVSLANYAGLQLAVSDWLARPDLDNTIPEFIRLTEAKLQRKFRGVTALTTQNTTNWLLTAHPDAYLYGALVEASPYLMEDARLPVWSTIFEQVVSQIRLPDTNANFDNYAGLQLAVSDWLARPDLDNVIPKFIELAEAKFQRKFRDVTSLTSQNTTNWLLTSHPDVYLYGALVEAQPYLMNDVRVAIWQTALEKSISEVRLPDTDSNFTNYTGLKFAISDWLDRPDLDNAIPNFIRLAEAKLQRKFVDVTTLTSQNTTNWLLTSHPDVYLYASLVEAAPYIKDDPRIPVWLENYNTRVAEVRRPSSTASFANYSGFKAMIADWLDRPDLTNIIPTLITMGEYRLQRDLRIRQMLVVATATTTSGDSTVGLPTNFLEMRDIHVKSTPLMDLKYLAPNIFYNNARTTESGLPIHYTVLGAEMQVAPIPDAVYTVQMLYYAKPSVLSDSNPSNVFLANCPDALLYATLGEASPYLMNDARLTTWAALYERAITAISTSDVASQYSGQPMSISVK